MRLAQSCQSAPTPLTSCATQCCDTRDVGLQTSETDVMRHVAVTETVWTLTRSDTATAATTQHPPRAGAAARNTDENNTGELLHPPEPAASAIEVTSAVECHSVVDSSTADQLVAACVQLVSVRPSTRVEATITNHETDKPTAVSATEEDIQLVQEDKDEAVGTETDKLRHPCEPAISASAAEEAQSAYCSAADCLDTGARGTNGQCTEPISTRHEEDSAVPVSATEQDRPTPHSTTDDDDETAAVGLSDTDHLLYPSEQATSAAASVVQTHSVDDFSTATQLVAVSVELIKLCSGTHPDDQCSEAVVTKHVEDDAAPTSETERDTNHPPTPAPTEDKDVAGDTDNLLHPIEPATAASATELDTKHPPTPAPTEDADAADVGGDSDKLLHLSEPATAIEITSAVQCHSVADFSTADQLVTVCVQLVSVRPSTHAEATVTKHRTDQATTATVEDTQLAPTPASTEGEVTETDKLQHPCEPAVSSLATETVRSTCTLAADCADTATDKTSEVDGHSFGNLSTAVHLSHTSLAVGHDAVGDDQRSETRLAEMLADTQHPASITEHDHAASEPATSASAITSVADSHSVRDASFSRENVAVDQRSKATSAKHVGDKEDTLLATLNRKLTTERIGDVTDRSSPSASASKVRTACSAN